MLARKTAKLADGSTAKKNFNIFYEIDGEEVGSVLRADEYGVDEDFSWEGAARAGRGGLRPRAPPLYPLTVEPWPVKLSRLSGSVRHCQGDCQAPVKASVKIHCQHCQASVRPLSSDLDSDHVWVMSRLSSRPLSGCQGCQALSGHAYPCRAGS